ncbi:hypothetical protein ACH42_04360 [Endozoicomonas sp. (ex Bugula neritina AB1)]|nr:hypothetical protein ACH42_04360 [Endozoicomonas sp. (ex Bugula neritina AB1)]
MRKLKLKRFQLLIVVLCFFLQQRFSLQAADEPQDFNSKAYEESDEISPSRGASANVISLLTTNRMHCITITSPDDISWVFYLFWSVDENPSASNFFSISTSIAQGSSNLTALSNQFPQLTRELLNEKFNVLSVGEHQTFTRADTGQMYTQLLTQGSGSETAIFNGFIPGLTPSLTPFVNTRLTLLPATPEEPDTATITITQGASVAEMATGVDKKPFAYIVFRRHVPEEQHQSPTLNIEYIRELENGYRMTVDISYLLSYEYLLRTYMDGDTTPTVHAIVERYLNEGRDAEISSQEIHNEDRGAEISSQEIHDNDRATDTSSQDILHELQGLVTSLQEVPNDNEYTEPYLNVIFNETNHCSNTEPASTSSRTSSIVVRDRPTEVSCYSEGRSQPPISPQQSHNLNTQLDKAICSIKKGACNPLSSSTSLREVGNAPNLSRATSMTLPTKFIALDPESLALFDPLQKSPEGEDTNNFGARNDSSGHQPPLMRKRPRPQTTVPRVIDLSGSSRRRVSNQAPPVDNQNLGLAVSLYNIPDELAGEEGYGNRCNSLAIPSNNVRDRPKTRRQRILAWIEKQKQKASTAWKNFRRK